MHQVKTNPNYKPVQLTNEQIKRIYDRQRAKRQVKRACEKALLHEATLVETPTHIAIGRIPDVIADMNFSSIEEHTAALYWKNNARALSNLPTPLKLLMAGQLMP